jgi:hypothetical protein
MPNVEQRSVGQDLVKNQLEPRLGLGWSVKTDPQEHGLMIRIKDYNDFMKPQMDAMMRHLKKYRDFSNKYPIQSENTGDMENPVIKINPPLEGTDTTDDSLEKTPMSDTPNSEDTTPEHPIDVKGFSDFLATANYTSGNLLHDYIGFMSRRMNEINADESIKPDTKMLWLKDYNKKLQASYELETANIREWNEYLKKNKDAIALTEEGKALENIGQKLSKVQSRK